MSGADRGSPLPAAAPKAEHVLVERRGWVARLAINRPPLNILDIDTLRILKDRLTEVQRDGGVRLIEVRGAGEKAFSAGTEVRDHLPDRAATMLQEFHAVLRAVLYSPHPTLAVVQGHCLGGGMELATCCDFIVASDRARFGQPEIKLGVFPPAASVLLPRVIPERRALEMLLIGESITAEEALGMGLINRVAREDELEAEVQKFTSMLLAKSAEVLALARRAARMPSRDSFETALREAERLYLDELLKTEDMKEGLQAFLENRPPRWKWKAPTRAQDKDR